jgi:hypothetical protein
MYHKKGSFFECFLFGFTIKILTGNLLCVYKTKTIFMNVQPQLERVSSTPPSRGRKNVSVRWREPPGALLSSISMDQVDFEILPPGALLSSISMDQVDYEILPPGALLSSVSMDQVDFEILPPGALLPSISMDQVDFGILLPGALLSSISKWTR